MKRKRNLVSFLVQKVKMQSHLRLLSGISKAESSHSNRNL